MHSPACLCPSAARIDETPCPILEYRSIVGFQPQTWGSGIGPVATTFRPSQFVSPIFELRSKVGVRLQTWSPMFGISQHSPLSQVIKLSTFLRRILKLLTNVTVGDACDSRTPAIGVRPARNLGLRAAIVDLRFCTCGLRP